MFISILYHIVHFYNSIWSKMYKKAKVLLINPWITDFTAYDLWMKPTGLLRIGRYLRAAGIDIDFIDLADAPEKRNKNGSSSIKSVNIKCPTQLENLFEKRYFKRFGVSYVEAANLLNSKSRPDLILLTSAMTYWYPGIKETISMLRKAYSTVPIWLGGNYADLCPLHASSLGADRVIIKNNYTQIAKKVFEVLRIRPSAGWSDLSRSEPFYPYSSDFYFITRLSTGCIHHCSYCASRFLDGDYKVKNIEQVWKDLKWALKKGFKNITFYDDALLGDNGKALKILLKKIKSWFYSRGRNQIPENFKFHIPNGIHAQKINAETAALMKEFNFEKIRLGYEFFDPALQENSGGKVNNSILAQAAQNLKNAGFDLTKEVIVYILCGAPDADFKELFDAVKFVFSTGCRPSLALYSPVPGTRDFKKWFVNTKFERDPLYCNKTAFTVISDFLSEENYFKLKKEIQLVEKTFNPAINEDVVDQTVNQN